MSRHFDAEDVAMTMDNWLDHFSLAGIFGLSMGLVLIAVGIGIGLGSMFKAGSTADRTSPGAVIGATLGFLAFMLAFTFNMASNRFDERKHLLVDEMSAIGTTFLRTDLLSEPYSAHAKTLLREYVDVRVSIVKDPRTLFKSIARSDTIQNELWTDAVKMSSSPDVRPYARLYVQSLNDMIDLQGKRVAAALYYRIPGPIWLGLFVITVIAMIAVGYQFGQTSNRHAIINLILAAAFSSVILLIADLDRESQGYIRVNQQPLFDLQQQLAPAKQGVQQNALPPVF